MDSGLLQWIKGRRSDRGRGAEVRVGKDLRRLSDMGCDCILPHPHAISLACLPLGLLLSTSFPPTRLCELSSN